LILINFCGERVVLRPHFLQESLNRAGSFVDGMDVKIRREA
jgi:hypothetical protein